MHGCHALLFVYTEKYRLQRVNSRMILSGSDTNESDFVSYINCLCGWSVFLCLCIPFVWFLFNGSLVCHMKKPVFGLLALLATFTFIKSFDEISTHVLKTHKHVLEFLI